MSVQQTEYDHSDHIIRTTSQWGVRAIAYWPIPRGVLCIELTPLGETKIKIGEGDKFYSQLPYVGGDDDLSNYYTKSEIDNIINNLNYMSIASVEIYPDAYHLPVNGNRLGDLRFVNNPNSEYPFEYIWNGEKWIPIVGIVDIDLSEYAKKSEVNPRLDALESEAHTHANKSILDNTTASYTTQEQSKLALLHNYDDTIVRSRIASLESTAHVHTNKSILDQTTASYTIEEKTKLAELENSEVFIGTDGSSAGKSGLVPAPSVLDVNKYLASDGTWKTVQGGGGGIEYVAGDGISIDQGSPTTELSSLQWVQGSINAIGQDDDTILSVVRSPLINCGLTEQINISALSIHDQELIWKLCFYDSNNQFILLSSSWSTFSDTVNKPQGASKLKILLTLDKTTIIDETIIQSCEISYPVEINKYVITNTGVTHIEMTDTNTICAIENNETKNIVSFGSDFEVVNGEVTIPDYNRLIINVEE